VEGKHPLSLIRVKRSSKASSIRRAYCVTEAWNKLGDVSSEVFVALSEIFIRCELLIQEIYFDADKRFVCSLSCIYFLAIIML